MSQIARQDRYSRMLLVCAEGPSRILPTDLIRRASAQSSMISWLMLSMPPTRSRVAARINMHPPAAALVRRVGSATQRGGEGLEKKKKKAGRNNFFQKNRQISVATRQTRYKPPH